MVKEFWRSVRIRLSYGKKSSGTFFSGHGVVVLHWFSNWHWPLLAEFDPIQNWYSIKVVVHAKVLCWTSIRKFICLRESCVRVCNIYAFVTFNKRLNAVIDPWRLNIQCSGTKRPRYFFVISSIKLGWFLWYLVHDVLNYFAAKSCNVFYFTRIMSLRYLVKLTVVIVHVLPLSC